MSSAATIEKLRRLLRLGTSSNEHEARAALAKAAEIAHRESIDLGSLKADDERERVAEAVFVALEAFDAVRSAAFQLCMSLFRVQVLRMGDTASFVGLAHNVEAAIFAKEFVMEQCGRDLKRFRCDMRNRWHRRISKGAALQYCLGWILGVKTNYRKEFAEAPRPAEIDDQKAALILRDQKQEVDDYILRNHGEVKTGKDESARCKSHPGALLAGFDAGLKMSINRPLDNSPGQTRATLTTGGAL